MHAVRWDFPSLWQFQPATLPTLLPSPLRRRLSRNTGNPGIISVRQRHDRRKLFRFVFILLSKGQSHRTHHRNIGHVSSTCDICNSVINNGLAVYSAMCPQSHVILVYPVAWIFRAKSDGIFHPSGNSSQQRTRLQRHHRYLR